MAGTEDNFVIQVDIDFRNAQQSVTRMVDILSRFNQTVDSPALRNAERNMAKFATGNDAATNSANKAADAQKKLVDQMSTTRYAMFSAAAALGAVSAGLIGFDVATIGAAASFERAWANVVRTSDDLRKSAALTADLRKQFIAMGQELPIAFQDLSAIGAMGNQLGVQTQSLASFTKVVAEFSTVTGMTTDATATAFGRLDAILPSVNHDFVALGSSILKAGVTSVATEEQIVKTTVQLSAMGTMAGLTGSEVIGLAAGFASIGVPPELARGTIVRLFSLMGKAVTAGGDSLAAFAQVSGVSSQQFANSYGKPGFGNTFLKFMEGIALKGGDARQTLNDLGIKSVRDVPALLNLANAADSTGKSFGETAGKMGLLTQVFGAAADGWSGKTEIFKQYAIISETVSAKLQILGNNFQTLLATIGGASTGPFAFLIDALTTVLKLVTSLASTPWGQGLSVLATVVAGLVGGLAALASTGALAFSAMVGLQQALNGMGFQAEAVGISALVEQLTAAGVSSKGLAVALGTVKVALAALAIGAVTAGVALLGNQIVDAERNWFGFGGSAEDAMKRIKGTISKYSFTSELSKVLNGNTVMAEFQRSFGQNNMQPVIHDLAAVDEQMAKIVGQGGGKSVAAELMNISNGFLAAGGSSAEFNAYMTDSVKAMKDAGYQFKYNKQGILDIIPPTKDATDAAMKAAAANGDLAAQQQLADQAASDLADQLNGLSTVLNTPLDGSMWSTDIIKKFNTDFSKAAGGFIDYQAAMDAAQQKTAEGAAVAAGKGKDSWKDYVDTSKVDMGTFTKVLQDQITAQGSWISDIGQLAGRGADAFAQGLVAMGPKGAAIAHAAVGMTTDELNKLEAQARIAAFYASAEFAGGFSSGFADMKKVFDQGGNEALAAYTNAMVSGVPGAVDAVLKQFNINLGGNPVTVQTTADPTGANKVLNDVVNQPRATANITADVDPTKGRQTLDQFLQVPRWISPLQANADPKEATHTLDEFALRPRSVSPLMANANPNPAQATLDQFQQTPRWISPLQANADPKAATNTLDQFIRTPRWLTPLQVDAGTQTASRTLDQFIRIPRSLMISTNADLRGADGVITSWINKSRTMTVHVATAPSPGPGVGPLTIDPYKKAAGGYISGPGTSTSDSIPAYLSNGEYVIKASAVRQVGIGYLDALNGGNAKLHSGNGYASGGYVSAPSGPSVVELSPTDRALLRAAGNLQVVIPGTMIANAANAQTVRNNNRGAY